MVLTQTISSPPDAVRSAETPVIAKLGFKTFGFLDSSHSLNCSKRRRRPSAVGQTTAQTTSSTNSSTLSVASGVPPHFRRHSRDILDSIGREAAGSSTHFTGSDEVTSLKPGTDQVSKDKLTSDTVSKDKLNSSDKVSAEKVSTDKPGKTHSSTNLDPSTHPDLSIKSSSTHPDSVNTQDLSSNPDLLAPVNSNLTSNTLHDGDIRDSDQASIPKQSTPIDKEFSADDFCLKIPQWPSRHAVGATQQELQAGQLTSFLSRVKYLYDESENVDAVPMAFPAATSTASAVAAAASSSSYTDQRALIRAQAMRIRNQLDMKFGAISFAAQLDDLSDQFGSETAVPHYNPLRTIRDRADPRITPHLPKRPSKTTIWFISVAELTQDLRWRFNYERAAAHKMRRKLSREYQERQKLQKEQRRQQRKLEKSQRRASKSKQRSSFDLPMPAVPVDDTFKTPPRMTSGWDAVLGDDHGSANTSTKLDTNFTSTLPAMLQGPALHSEGQPMHSEDQDIDSNEDSDSEHRDSPSHSYSDDVHSENYAARKDQFTGSLPQSKCTELINRLRSSHDENEIALLDDESGDDNRSLLKQYTRSGSTSSSAALVDCDAPLNSDEYSWAKRRFCRNSASVADTWNRMYRQRQNSNVSDSMGAGPVSSSTPAVNGLKPPSLYSLGSLSGMSRRSSYTSEVDENRSRAGSTSGMTNVDASLGTITDPNALGACTTLTPYGQGTSSSVSTTSTQVNSNSSSSDNLGTAKGTSGKQLDAPMLVLTPENGHEVVLDSSVLQGRRGSAAFLMQQQQQQQQQSLGGKFSTHPSASSPAISAMNSSAMHNSSPALAGKQPTNIWLDGEFGSLSNDSARRDPYEKKCCILDTDLRYLVSFYKTALHRPGPTEVLKRANDIDLARFSSSSQLSASLKDGAVTDFLKYLGGIENMLVKQQQELDANVATSLDGLRVATDLMVSEVNTNLNRRIREIGSRMERISSRHTCEVYTNALYLTIEYIVLFLMWAIWCIVKLVRLMICPVKAIRYIGDNFIVA